MTTEGPSVATIGSHSALQVLKGAHDEGLPSAVIAARPRDRLYRRYGFVDDVLAIDSYGEFEQLEGRLNDLDAVLVPHGSFVAYLGREANEHMPVDYFGSRAVLRWEADRGLQRRWLEGAGLTMPAAYDAPGEVEHWPVLVKTDGAAGGSGYFLANSPESLARKLGALGDTGYTIQRYTVGVTLYVHYFRSIIRDRLEILSMDRRYETDVDALGRLPIDAQEELRPSPTFVVVGNSPLVLRESMLETAYEMGERVVAWSKEHIDPRGLWGPFCLETIITPDLRFHIIEISCRIVAGTNLYVHGSPYAALWFDEPMSTGRRIARELREAEAAGRRGDVVSGPIETKRSATGAKTEGEGTTWAG